MARTGLLYHNDVDFSVPIQLLKTEFNWQKVDERLKQATVNPISLFKEESENTQIRQKRRRGLGL